MEVFAETPSPLQTQCPQCGKWTGTGGKPKFECAHCGAVVVLETGPVETLEGGNTDGEDT